MFLRSRTRMKSVVTEVEDVVGRSSLLLATLLIPQLDHDANDATDTDMIVNESEPEIRCMYWTNFDFPSLTRSHIACNYSTEAPRQALDIPLDAHVLPGCGRRLNCLLPFFCSPPDHKI